jgi:signal transduction histidine kinase/CheY-like chemotaxis protein
VAVVKEGKRGRYRALYDLVPVAIWEEDWTKLLPSLRQFLDQGITDLRPHVAANPGFTDDMLRLLRVHAVNPAAVEMFRAVDADDLIRRGADIFDDTDPHDVFLLAMNAVLQGQRRIEGITTLRRLTGERMQVQYRIALPRITDEDGRVVICEMDISAAHEANERFGLVVRATSDVIWDYDMGRDHLWVSDGIQRIFGIPPEEVTGSLHLWLGRVHPDDIDTFLRDVDVSEKIDRAKWEKKYRLRNGADRYVWVRDEGFIQRDVIGAPVRMVGSLVDITDQQRLEDQLLRSQKLEAIGKLTGGMAHDFNNLLTVVMGSLESLEDHLGDDPVARQYLAVANSAVDRSAQLIDRLLSYTRKQPIMAQSVDIARQVQDTSQILQRALGEQIGFAVEAEPGLWPCRTDPGQFDSALLNLCINARDAMPRGGRVTISLRNQQIAPLDPSGLPPGPYVSVTLADTGEGMDAATLQAAFDPFFTTKEFGAGSGLGLTMVQGFAHQSKGAASIRSEPGVGTQVTLHLPAEPAAALASTEETPARAAAGRRTGRVLLVEDQEILRAHMAGLLERLGLRVIAAGHVEEALTILASEGQINLVVTDIILPGGQSGLDLGYMIGTQYPGLPVIYMSGYSDTVAGAEQRLRAGENFLRKPFRSKELAEMLDLVLAPS